MKTEQAINLMQLINRGPQLVATEDLESLIAYQELQEVGQRLQHELRYLHRDDWKLIEGAIALTAQVYFEIGAEGAARALYDKS